MIKRDDSRFRVMSVVANYSNFDTSEALTDCKPAICRPWKCGANVRFLICFALIYEHNSNSSCSINHV